AALVALIFGLAPDRGPTIALYVATAFAATAAVVSMLRIASPQPDASA
ncbi:TPA: MFS transporter, partial [Burkholderia multivorans]